MEPAIDTTALSPQAQLNRNSNFNLAWAGLSLSSLGTAFTTVVLPLLVYDATQSAPQMGLVSGMQAVGAVLGGLFAGGLVDRTDRRKLMVGSDLLRAAVLAPIPLVWVYWGPSIAVICVSVLICQLLTMQFNVAYISALKGIVRKDLLIHANSRLHATDAAMGVIGPLLAGLFCAHIGSAPAVWVDVASYLVSAAALSLVTLPPLASTESARTPTFLGDVRIGAVFIARSPVLRPVVLLMAGTSFCSSAIVPIFVYYLRHDLQQSEGMVGLVFGVAAVGAVAGGLLTPWIRRKVGFAAALLSSTLVQGAALFVVGLSSSLLSAVLLAAAFMVAEYVRVILWSSFRQEQTPDELLGRVAAAAWTLCNLVGPIGTGLVTLMADRLGTRAAFMTVGALGVTFFLGGLFSGIRRTERAQLQA